jgi:hypothetical protein
VHSFQDWLTCLTQTFAAGNVGSKFPDITSAGFLGRQADRLVVKFDAAEHNGEMRPLQDRDFPISAAAIPCLPMAPDGETIILGRLKQPPARRLDKPAAASTSSDHVPHHEGRPNHGKTRRQQSHGSEMHRHCRALCKR